MSRSGLHDFVLQGTGLVPGEAEGELLCLDEPISFRGGVDPATGTIIDVHHPQRGMCMRDRILVLPGSKGSTAGPGALLETIFAGKGPRGVLLTRPDLVCVIAATAAMALRIPGIAVLALATADAARLRSPGRCRTSGERAWIVT